MTHNYSGSAFRVQDCPPPAAPAKAKKLLAALIILFLLVLPFSSSSGKVFLSRFLTQGQSIFDTIGSWRQIYKAPLTINGARAELSIHGCDEPLELVTTRLKEHFGSSAKSSFAGNENSFRMISAAGRRLTRMLALAMPASDQSLIFTIEQTPAEFLKSTAVPAGSIFPGEPLLPGSRLETIIKNEETGTALETRIADAAPGVIINEISAKLSRHGWQLVAPSGGDGNANRHFLIFRRGKALCALLAGPALSENKSCVTILLKEKMDNKGE